MVDPVMILTLFRFFKLLPSKSNLFRNDDISLCVGVNSINKHCLILMVLITLRKDLESTFMLGGGG